MKKQFFAAAMILALSAGFTACSSDDLNVKDQKEVKNGKEATGYLTYTFSVATPSGTRAANDEQGDETSNPGYNFVEKWAGNDKIEKVTAYIFDGDQPTAAFEKKEEATLSDFDKIPGTDGKVTYKPKKGIKVTVGKKTVFLVVNSTSDVTTLLDSYTNLGAFQTAYESSNLAFASRTPNASVSAAANATAAEQLYKSTTSGVTVVMTGAKATNTVVAGVEQTATTGVAVGSTDKNRFNFTVKRAVATVFVTAKKASFEIKGDNPTTAQLESDAVIATIEGLNFSQGQGELKLYFQQKDAATADNTAYQTPAYSFVPKKASAAGVTPVVAAVDYAGAADKYDYNGLWKKNNVATLNKDALVAGDGEAQVKTANVVPFLPATHQWNAEGTNYIEGNTAYVLVRGTLKPKFVYELVNGEFAPMANPATATTFFYGSDGKFYKDKDAVEKAYAKDNKFTAKMYKDGVAIYTLWINPDKTDKTWKNAPTNRNNIYHISIKDIKTIGENGNPLVPGGVKNPDPIPTAPDSPHEPAPKHDPYNPLSPVETWMSVDATILPWAIHSYGVDL